MRLTLPSLTGTATRAAIGVVVLAIIGAACSSASPTQAPASALSTPVASAASTAAATGAASAPAATTASSPTGSSACDSTEKVKIGFSAPAADHGWLGAIIKNADDQAAKYTDVEWITASGGADADAQANNIRTLVQQQPDVVAILPYDGGALTPVAEEITGSGIPVVNIDREFSDAGAYRTLIKGDNYGIGWAAGKYISERLKGTGNVVEIQGIAGISVTDQRTQGFKDAIEGTNIKIVAQQPADFDPDKGAPVMETILQGQSERSMPSTPTTTTWRRRGPGDQQRQPAERDVPDRRGRLGEPWT